MLLYVNGDSHAAAAEAVNPHCFAEDDPQYFYLGRVPHPDNLSVSWARRLADSLHAGLICQAESASSNTRILRTAREWIKNGLPQYPSKDVLVVIQWSTWERQEWLIEGKYYQVNASGIDHVPDSHQDWYKQYIANVDWFQAEQQAHEEIWQFHNELKQQNIPHLFFNGNSHFERINKQLDWGPHYIGPYEKSMTYSNRLKQCGFHTVMPNSWHFGTDAHSFWSRYIVQYLLEHKMVG